MEQSSHAWLKKLEAVYVQILAEPSERTTAFVREDVEKLLVRVREQLNGVS